jgi:hypothetical protein
VTESVFVMRLEYGDRERLKIQLKWDILVKGPASMMDDDAALWTSLKDERGLVDSL